MSTRKLLGRLIFSLIVVGGVAAIGMADTIRLRDGSVLKGKVVSYSQRKFTIVVNIGGTTSQHVISADEIDSVEFDGTSGEAGGGRFESAPPVSSAPSPSRGGLTREAPPEAAGNAPASAASTQVGGDIDNGLPTLAEKTVSVAAAADWTSTEIRVQRGQRIVISATGEVDLGDNQRTGPEGLTIPDTRKLVAAKPTGALIAVVGDDNDDFIFIGKASEFTAKHNGILFLSVNEGNLKDNNGAFVARVKVYSNR